MLAHPTSSRVAWLSSVSLLALVGALASVACTESSDGSPGTDDSGAPDGGAEGATCSNEGAGSIAIVVTGLPDGVDAKITLTTPAGAEVEAAPGATLADQPAGTYAVTAARAASPDPVVRTLYEASVSESPLCLADGESKTVTVTYAPVPSSHKLWATNSNASGQLLAFAAGSLTETGSPSASVATTGASGQGAHAGRSIAFDKDGNAWGIGATTVDAPLLRFAAADLGESGAKTPDRKIKPAFGTCLPGLASLAFAPDGALWATATCDKALLRVPSAQLAESGEYTPDANDVVSGLEGPRHLAFDRDGNLWISDETRLRRFAAAALEPGQPHESDFEIEVKSADDAALPPDLVAFDAEGNLWVSSFGANAIYKLTPANLAPEGASRTLVPSVHLSIPVSALLEGLAFDESGGLWLTYSQGKIARLAPSQLGTSTTPGNPTIPETIVTSAEIGSAGGLAFFPAPAALPLYGRFE